MKNLKLLFLIGAGLFFAVSSCKKDKIDVENPGANETAKPAVLDIGNNVTAKFFARVVDENNVQVHNATIKIGNKTATTDLNGIAIIPSVSVPEKLAYLTATKAGYFLGSRSVIPQTTETNEIKIVLLKKEILTTIQSGEAASVSTSSGLTIDFKGAYVKEDGSAYSGSVNVAIKHINPDSDDFSDQMPGSLFAQDESNNSGVLESYGMGAIEIFTPGGEELQIAKGSSATMKMPISASQLSKAPATIPLWHFDEVAGYWIEEGEATLVNGEYVGEVQHFSFWNCDDFYDDAEITGLVLDAAGNPLPYCTVEILTPNQSTTGTTSSAGTFSSFIPANVVVTFNVFDNCGNLVSTWANTFNTNSSTSHTFNSSAIISSTNTTISGTLLDCNNNAVANGYVSISINTVNYFPVVSNGAFSITLGNCNIVTNFTVQGYDFTNIQATNSLTFTATGSSTNIGNIIACNAASEYITYTVDNDPAITFFAPITCYDSITGPSTSAIKIQCFGTIIPNAYFILEMENSAIGSYNFIDFGSATPGVFLEIMDLNWNSGYPNITFNLNAHGAVGSYVDITFSGIFLDYNNLSHTISGSIHALRDY